jgi:uncharacterized protein DUF3825
MTLSKASGQTAARAGDLKDWAHFPKGAEGAAQQLSGFSVAIQRLRDLALREQWEFGQASSKMPNPILRNYLRWTFFRLWRERKIAMQGDYAAINTGLVDHRYEPIYAVFGKNKLNPGRQPWYFVGFCIAGEDQIGKTLVRFFKPLPLAAHYFGDPRSMFYDLSAGEPTVDWEHVIVENVDRLPRSS